MSRLSANLVEKGVLLVLLTGRENVLMTRMVYLFLSLCILRKDSLIVFGTFCGIYSPTVQTRAIIKRCNNTLIYVMATHSYCKVVHK